MPNTVKHASLENLSVFVRELKNRYAKKADLTAVSGRVTALENIGAQAKVLEGVKVNGTALEIAEKMVDILFATGTTNGTVKMNGVEVSVAGLAALAYKANISQTDLDAALADVISAKANSSDVYSKTEVDSKISSVYKPGGSVAFADLPVADEAHLGLVYNVTTKFTTTDNFLEGAGGKHAAGTNVVIVKRNLPTHVLLKSLSQDSTAICEQITTVSVERIGEYCGHVSTEEMHNLEDAMLTSLGIVRKDGDAQLAEAETRCAVLQQMYDALLSRVVR